VAFEVLDHDAAFGVPHFASVVGTGGDHAGALVVELTFGDLLFVADEHADALAGERVLNAASVVRTHGTQFASSRIETHVQHFIRVVLHRANASAHLDVPEFDRVVCARGRHEVS